MFKSFIIMASIACAAGCSAAQESGEAEDEGELSSAEQAIGEASCAAARPANAAATVTLNNAEVDRPRKVVNGAYESTASGCADSDIMGLKRPGFATAR